MNPIVDIFTALAMAIENGVNSLRVSKRDKEFHFQDWFGNRLREANIIFDSPGRNTYPDFRLVDFPIGFEVKGLGFPGREANFDCNSQIPTGRHNGRDVYYVFGRYPSEDVGTELCIYDLILCHGDFLNSDHEYIHSNKNIKGFGSYGDIMIRDRKMYVCPTPFALTKGTKRQATLILPESVQINHEDLALVGVLARKPSTQKVVGYTFDLMTNLLTPNKLHEEKQAAPKIFHAYKLTQFGNQPIEMIQ